MSEREKGTDKHVEELQARVERILDVLLGVSFMDCIVILSNVMSRFSNEQLDPDGSFLRLMETSSIVYRKVREMRNQGEAN